MPLAGLVVIGSLRLRIGAMPLRLAVFIFWFLGYPLSFSAKPSTLEMLSPISLKKPSFNEFSHSLQTLSDWLTERTTIDHHIPIDLLFLFGNDDLKVFDEIAGLYKKVSIKFILVTGGIGRLTIPLLQHPEVFDRLPEIIPGIDLTKLKKTVKELEEASDISQIKLRLSPFGISEAILIKALLIRRGIPPEAFLEETESRNTPENVSLAHEMLKKMNLLKGIKRVLLMQTPVQQRRARYTFLKKWPGSDLDILSYAAYTMDVKRLSQEERLKLGLSVRDEVLRIFAYGDRKTTGYANAKDDLVIPEKISYDLLNHFLIVDTYIKSEPRSRDLNETRNFLIERIAA